MRKIEIQEICNLSAKITKKNDREILREDWYQTKEGKNLLLLRYPLLEQTGVVKHCFTTRYGGVSEGMLSSMNLSFSRGDARQAVEENFRRLAEALDVQYEKFVFTDQTHTTNVRRVTEEDAGKGLLCERGYSDVDGLITNEKGLVLSTFFADCVPIYFVDPVHCAIGMSHSGWRGTAKRMGAVTIEAMRKEYGSRPEDLICAIGPSICRDCYEVSADVAEKFAAAFPQHVDEILTKNPCLDKKRDNVSTKKNREMGKENVCSGEHAEMPMENTTLEKNGVDWWKKEIGNVEDAHKYQLDLWKTNEIVLLEAGITPEHLAVTNICTCCNPEVLFSHRASKGLRGNLGGFLCLI